MASRIFPELDKCDFEGVAWPPVLLGDNAILAAMMRQLDETQWFPQARLREGQSRQLAALVRHHEKTTPSFLARLGAAGLHASVLCSVDDLKHLPPLLRSDLQDQGDNFFSRFVPRSHMPVGTTKTSGSTGEPVTVRKTAVNRLFWAANNLRDDLWHGRDFKQRITAIKATISNYAEAPDWGLPASGLFVTGRSQGMPITFDIEEQMRRIQAFRPAVLAIYPNNFAAYLDIWEERGFDCGFLKHIKSMGETVSDALRERSRRITGLAIEDSYSSQELGQIAIQCPESGLYHIMSETLYVEIVDDNGAPCKAGEIGRVLVTDLHNFSSPLIRYDIGDYAEAGQACACGRGLPVLRRIVGRTRNLLVLPDGRKHWPLVGYQQFAEVAKVRQYQFIQHSLQDIEFKVVTDEPLTEKQCQALIRIAREALGHPFDIRIVRSDARLERDISGKFEEFISRV